jgi:hypothetical protein
MRPSFVMVNVAGDTSAEGPTLSETLGALNDCRASVASEPSATGRLASISTVNDGGSMGAATTARGFGGRRPPPARRQRTWIWTPSQGKHHHQTGEFPSVKAAARQASIVTASFDRTKRLLEKHASSFTAFQKAELREMLGKVEHGVDD